LLKVRRLQPAAEEIVAGTSKPRSIYGLVHFSTELAQIVIASAIVVRCIASYEHTYEDETVKA
jgi:hypothetical protein